MTESEENILERILAETHSYQQLIDDKQWDQLDKEMKARQLQLEKIYSVEVSDSDASIHLDFIKKIQQLDKSYQNQIKSQKNRMANEAIETKNKFKAVKAYTSVHQQ